MAKHLVPVFVNNMAVSLQSLNVPENVDINYMTECLTEVFKCASSCMYYVYRSRKFKRINSWFDNECYKEKKRVYGLLKGYTLTHDLNDRLQYLTKRREYKHLIKQKKLEFDSKITIKLNSRITDTKSFWHNIKQLHNRSRLTPNITKQEWFDHFYAVFNVNLNANENVVDVLDAHGAEDNLDYPGCDVILNAKINVQDIKKSIATLKANKAAGPDGLVSEMFKCSLDEIMPFLLKLFNSMFTSGVFPEMWTKSTIVPLHKKGSYNNADNFRGISLTSVFSKVFIGILNERLKVWSDTHNIITEEQAGFRKGYSTIDNAFILQTLIQKYLTKKRKLYVAFIDFRKAFDSVDRCIMWQILQKNGITGEMLNILKSIYNSVISNVKCNNENTDCFSCPNGLKQGCIMSPMLFSYLVQEITNEIRKRGGNGIQLFPGVAEIAILLFADDIVLIADTVFELQKKLNVLQETAFRLGLIVNMDKSKVVVFRKGGPLAAHEKWFIGNNQLLVVNQYCYLGLIFSSTLSSNIMMSNLAVRGRTALVTVLKALAKVQNISTDVFFKLFDAQIQTILLYGAEMWGMENCNVLENVHLYAMKKCLRVPIFTPNVMIYGDTGRHEIGINAIVRSIKYWLKILKMNESRYVRKVYNMMLHDDCSDNWAGKIKEVLFRFNFVDIWESQQVVNTDLFLRNLRDRMIHVSNTNWLNTLYGSERYGIYRMFKKFRYKEQYLNVIDSTTNRKLLTFFRMGVSSIFSHRSRFTPHADTLCPLCNEYEEDDIHFLLHCPVYYDLRQKYLHIQENIPPNQDLFQVIMARNEPMLIQKLSLYIYYALKRRNDYIIETDILNI